MNLQAQLQREVQQAALKRQLAAKLNARGYTLHAQMYLAEAKQHELTAKRLRTQLNAASQKTNRG